MSYGNGISALYRFAALTVSGGAEIGRIKGPDGAEGRLISVTSVVTTDVTVAAAGVQVGNGSDANAYADHSIPVSSAGATVGTFTRGVETRIAADTDILIADDGAATAGAADICVLIEWYGGDAS